MGSVYVQMCSSIPPKPPIAVDRRNVVIGIGAANLVYPLPKVTAEPIPPPPMDRCSRGTDLNTKEPLKFDCCPPKPKANTQPPPLYHPNFSNTKLRLRRPAQSLTTEYIEKFENAVQLMKALPDDDPRSFKQQANVHCAYCNLVYSQTETSDLKLQIHYCWHFYPFHRWYLFFYERILGKLINDPQFALPFWNWDNPNGGMVIPSIYIDPKSSLYDEHRDPNHYPPSIADLQYKGEESNLPPDTMIKNNLAEMYRELVTNGSTLTGFYGEKYVVGTDPSPGGGSVEIGSHTALHRWVGERTKESYDMGNFSTAGRDLIFYGHHANIDRLWSEWRSVREKKKKPSIFNEPDWLKGDYLFYDEHGDLVRVNVEDSLDTKNLGYTYEKTPNVWLNNRPKPKMKKSQIVKKVGKVQTIFPVKLDKVVKVLVNRPRKRRGKKEKEDEEEVIEIEGIQVESESFVRFEVFVNNEDDKPEELIANSEYVGCFSVLPNKDSAKIKSKLRLGLTELLEDLDIEDDDKILVSIVPKAGGEGITIGGIKIIYAS